MYFVGSQPSKAEKEKTARRARTTAGKAAARAAGPKRSPFRQPPSWVRRLPLLLVVAAVVCLVIAVAQFRVAKAQKTPVIALVLDTSKSMDADGRAAEPFGGRAERGAGIRVPAARRVSRSRS